MNYKTKSFLNKIRINIYFKRKKYLIKNKINEFKKCK